MATFGEYEITRVETAMFGDGMRAKVRWFVDKRVRLEDGAIELNNIDVLRSYESACQVVDNLQRAAA